MRIAIANGEIIRHLDWLRAIAALPGACEPRLHFGANAQVAAFADAADPATDALVVCGETLDALPAALGGLRARNPNLRAVALVDPARAGLADALIGAGITAILALEAAYSPDQRLDALRLALSGVRFVDPALLPAQPSASIPAECETAPPKLAALSHRQREIVSLISGGASNKQIARALSLSEATVKSHLTATMRRLGLSSRLQLAVAATRGGVSVG